jgi:hypothetical protein
MRRTVGTVAAIVILAVIPVHAAFAAASTTQFPLVATLESFAADVVTGIEHIAQTIGQNLAALTGSAAANNLSSSASAAAAATPPSAGAASASTADPTNSPFEPASATSSSGSATPSNVQSNQATTSQFVNPASSAPSAQSPSPINIFAIQSALGLLAARVQGLAALISAQPSSNIESQIAALQSAISQGNSQSYNAFATPPLGGGAPNTIAAASAIDQLSGTTITNPSITGGTIAGTSLSGGPVSATSLSVSGTSALSGDLSVGGNFTAGSISFGAASSTAIIAANATTTNLVATNATSTTLFSTFGHIATAIIDTLTTSIANISGLTAINSTTTNATTTNLYAASAVIPTLSGTSATFSGATSTSFFATTASSTNLFATTGTIGVLSAGKLALTGTTGTTTIASGQGFTIGGSQFLVQQGSGNVGIGTTTPGSLLSVSGIANFATATSTFYSTGGINLTGGCFAIAGNCLNNIGSGANSWTGLQTFQTGYVSQASSTVVGAFTNTGLTTHGGGFVSQASSTIVGAGTITGAAALGSTLGVTGLSTLASGFVSQASSTNVGNFTATGFINTSGTAGGYQIDGNTILYASTTNQSLAVGQAGGSWIYSTSTALFDTAVGYLALKTTPTNATAQFNTAVGYQTLYSNTTGHDNTALGCQALIINTTGVQNTALGSAALYVNTSGSNNAAIGFQALYNNASGINNFAGGLDALQFNTTGSTNAAIGLSAMDRNTTGSTNAAMGASAEFWNLSATNTVAIGYAAANGAGGYSNQGGVAIGYSAGSSFATGSDYNTLLGFQSGYGITTGARNVLLGQSTIAASYNQVTTGSNNISIGNDVAVASSTLSNQLNIGNIIFGTGINGTGNTISSGNIGIGTTTPAVKLDVNGDITDENVLGCATLKTDTTGKLNCISSDERLKQNITSLDASSSLAAINALNPVSFYWRNPLDGLQLQLGFIAQQVAPIFPDLISTNTPTALTPNGTLTFNYLGLIAPIVRAIQQLDQEITSLANTVAGFADSFTTKELTFKRATGQQLCLQKSDGTFACVNGDQLAAVLASANQSGSSATPPPSSSANNATDTPPVIQINGDNPALIHVGATYNDLGATITAPLADINLGIETYLNGSPVSAIQLDTTQAATDTIGYVVADSQGLSSTSTRTVVVEAAAKSPTSPPQTDATSTTQ